MDYKQDLYYCLINKLRGINSMWSNYEIDAIIDFVNCMDSLGFLRRQS